MKFLVVYIHNGDVVGDGDVYNNRSDAQAYCEELNHYAKGPAYKVVGVDEVKINIPACTNKIDMDQN